MSELLPKGGTPSVPEVLLLCYLAGELPEAERQRIADVCARSPELAAQLDALRRAQTQFLAAHSPEAFAHQVMTRIQVERPPGRRWRTPFLWALAPLSAAAAATLIVTVVHHDALDSDRPLTVAIADGSDTPHPMAGGVTATPAQPVTAPAAAPASAAGTPSATIAATPSAELTSPQYEGPQPKQGPATLDAAAKAEGAALGYAERGRAPRPATTGAVAGKGRASTDAGPETGSPSEDSKAIAGLGVAAAESSARNEAHGPALRDEDESRESERPADLRRSGKRDVEDKADDQRKRKEAARDAADSATVAAGPEGGGGGGAAAATGATTAVVAPAASAPTPTTTPAVAASVTAGAVGATEAVASAPPPPPPPRPPAAPAPAPRAAAPARDRATPAAADAAASFGTLQLSVTPPVFITYNGARVAQTIVLKSSAGTVVLGGGTNARTDPFRVTLRFRVGDDGGITYALDAAPWAIVRGKGDVGLGKTPLPPQAGEGTTSFELANPKEGRTLRLTIRFVR